MKKLLYLLLLPLLVLTVKANYRSDSNVVYINGEEGSSFSINEHSNAPVSINCNSRGGQKSKNAIRIKAKDSVTAAVLTSIWQPTIVITYITSVKRFLPDVPLSSTYSSVTRLRGPPIA